MRTIALVLLLSISLSGCAAVVVGAGAAATWVWVRGSLEATFDSSLPDVEAATRKALDELDLVAIDGAVDGLRGKLTARMASGTKVRVSMKALDFESTEVKVRVGTFGQKASSEQIMRHIERAIGAD